MHSTLMFGLIPLASFYQTDVVGTMSLLLSAAAIVITILVARNPRRITVVVDYPIDLASDITRSFGELVVLHNGLAVNGGLILWRGLVLNEGSKDIVNGDVFDPLTMTLPVGHTFRLLRIPGETRGVNAVISHDENTGTITWDILRSKECVLWEALVEGPTVSENRGKGNRWSSHPLVAGVRYSHRIKDTRPIVKVLLPLQKDTQKNSMSILGLNVPRRAMYYCAVVGICAALYSGYQLWRSIDNRARATTAELNEVSGRLVIALAQMDALKNPSRGPGAGPPGPCGRPVLVHTPFRLSDLRVVNFPLLIVLACFYTLAPSAYADITRRRLCRTVYAALEKATAAGSDGLERRAG